jgi:hypothetical protein
VSVDNTGARADLLTLSAAHSPLNGDTKQEASMAALTLNATANGLPAVLNLYISVSRSDGSPVSGLTGENFSVQLGHNVFPSGMRDVPTTLMYPEVDEFGEPKLDDEGNPKQINASLVFPQGLPGCYGMSVNAPPGGAYALQVRVQAGSDQGQTVVAPA